MFSQTEIDRAETIFMEIVQALNEDEIPDDTNIVYKVTKDVVINVHLRHFCWQYKMFRVHSWPKQK